MSGFWKAAASFRESRKGERMSGNKGRSGKKTARQAGKRQKVRTNRLYKDTVFRMLFREKKRLLGLYNAVSGRDYKDPEKLDAVMLESAVYLGMKNDLAFIIDMKLYLMEHQSTVNPNMPLRFLQYVAAEYEKLTVSENLHRRSLVKIPAPHFVVFYNGTEKYPEKKELRLSAAYETEEEDPELELRVQVLNINQGYNEGLKEACRTLKEYMQYVDTVRAYAKEMPLDEAVDRAVDECIGQDILRDFLLRNKAEVKHMSIFEYNEEAVRRVLREEAVEEGYGKGYGEGYGEGYEKGQNDGKTDGRIEDILFFLKEKGSVPEALEKHIKAETDENTLRKWLKLAGSTGSIEEFQMNFR